MIVLQKSVCVILLSLVVGLPSCQRFGRSGTLPGPTETPSAEASSAAAAASSRDYEHRDREGQFSFWLLSSDTVSLVNQDGEEEVVLDRGGFLAAWDVPSGGILLYDPDEGIYMMNDGEVHQVSGMPSLYCDGEEIELLVSVSSDFRPAACEGCFLATFTPDEGIARGEFKLAMNLSDGKWESCSPALLDDNCELRGIGAGQSPQPGACASAVPKAEGEVPSQRFAFNDGQVVVRDRGDNDADPVRMPDLGAFSLASTSPDGQWSVLVAESYSGDYQHYKGVLFEHATGRVFSMEEAPGGVAPWPAAVETLPPPSSSDDAVGHVDIVDPLGQIQWINGGGVLVVRASPWAGTGRSTVFRMNWSRMSFDGVVIGIE